MQEREKCYSRYLRRDESCGGSGLNKGWGKVRTELGTKTLVLHLSVYEAA